MRFASSGWLALLLASSTACSSSSSPDDTTGDGAVDSGPLDSGFLDTGPLDSASLDSGPLDSEPVDAGPFDCAPSESSDLPGVAMRFTSDTCTFTLAQAAAGITIPYAVKVDRDISGVVLGYDSRDFSRRTEPGSSGLHVFEMLSGGAQKYCLCDSGLPSPPDTTARALKIGTYPLAFTWDGKNWGGASDTGTPKGAPFPAGVYLLEVRAQGTAPAPGGSAPFAVNASIKIRLVP